MKNRIVIAFFLLFSTNLLYGQTTTMSDNVTFSTTQQSIWGPGNAFVSDIDVTLFNVPWNTSFGPAGGIANVGYGFGNWGGQISAGTWGNIGARFYMKGITAGYVDVDYPIQADITFPSANTIDRGTWVTINTDYNVTNGWALNSSPPSIGETALEMTTNLNAYIHPTICIGACVSPNVDVNVNETFPIFLMNQNEAIYPGVTGSYNGSCPPPGFGYCTNPTPTAGLSLPVWIKQNTFPVPLPGGSLGISGFLDLPSTPTNDYIAGTCLGAFGSKKYVEINCDLIKFMGNFVPGPVGVVMQNLSNSYNIGPVNFTYNLFSSTLSLDLYNEHQYDFCPNVEGSFNFPIAMNYEEVDPISGAILQTGFAPSATVDLGNDLRVEYPCNYEFADIGMDYNIKDEANFTSHIYDVLDLTFTIQALQFDLTLNSFQLFPGIWFPEVCVSIPYPCPTWSNPGRWCSSTSCFGGWWIIPPINIPGFTIGTGGPLINIPFNLASFSYDWYQGTYPLGGFSTQTGGTFTLDAMEYSASATGLDIDCKGDATGQMTATIVNGVAPFTYTWPDGSITTSVTQSSTNNTLLAGYNYVTIEDANNCQVVTDIFLNEPSQSLEIYNFTTSDIDCFGNANGQINISVTGGTPPYSYVWVGSGSTTSSATNLTAGPYSVTVTDANNCTTTGAYTITEPTAVAAAVAVNNDVSCFGGADGSATITGTGGTYPYAYTWSTGGQSSTENGLPAGPHSVNLTDANGCNVGVNYAITEPAAGISLTVTSLPVSCKNGSDGSIDLTVVGGTAPYTFKWFDQNFVQLSATTEDLTGMTSQNYIVEVLDSKGCLDTISVFVAEPIADLTASLVSQTNVSCFAGSDGAIDANVSGGTAPYVYNWSNGGLTEDINGIPAGNYVLDVTDLNSCTHQLIVNITEPAAPLASTLTFVDVLCNGDATGSIDLSVSGGTTPYAFTWNNLATTEDISGLTANNYNVVITDAKGCINNNNATISEPTALNLTQSAVDVLCFGGNNGSVNANVTGGVFPYSYSWSDGLNNQLSNSTNSMTNLFADVYGLTVTDSNACTISTSITVNEPAAPISITQVTTDVLCRGDNSGAIDITVTGGTGPYTFAWSNGAITEDVSGLIAGSYSVVVTDANACIDSISVTITQPASNVQIVVDKKDVLCKGDNSGWAYATVTGGIGPYLINWNNGDITNLSDSLIAGVYTVQAIDANGCVANSGTVINEPLTNITFSATSIDASCFGSNDGTITVTPMDGVMPYTVIFGDTSINLFNNNLNSYTIENLHQGNYPVQVEDGNGCRYLDSIYVDQPDSLVVIGTPIDATCFGFADGAIGTIIQGGTTPYTTIWSNATVNQNLVGVTAGWYTINVIDFNGCTALSSWQVEQPDEILISPTITDPSCRDNHDGSITIFTEGGIPGYDYLWSNSEITSDVFDLAPGQYVLIVTDQNGCEKYDTLNINLTDIDCIAPPNAFTPDGDGYNDTWILDNLDNYPEAEVSIFNKWGNLVYQTKGIYSPWDGSYDGKILPAATYYYVIKLNNGTAPYSGAVTLVILK